MLDHDDLSKGSDLDPRHAPNPDPLARIIVADLLRTTAVFLLIVTAIVLAVHIFS